MLKKGHKLFSIIYGTCPKCHEESMYTHANPYRLKHMITMHDQCSHCGTKYKIEPSFFYGAMYVSYAVGIAFAVAAFVISFTFFQSSLPVAFVAIVATEILFAPIIIRVSRNIWINIFMGYDQERAKKN